MSDESPNTRIGAEIYQKFQFYIVGLTFGVLALSVQTAGFAGPVGATIAELLGWVLLLSSGMTGLSRLEWMPKQYHLSGLRDDTQGRAHHLQKAAQGGTEIVHVTLEKRDYPIADLINRAHSDLKLLDSHMGTVDRRAILKYRFQKWSFIGGLLSLLVARGLGPLLGLL